MRMSGGPGLFLRSAMLCGERKKRLSTTDGLRICERKQSTNKNHGFQTQVQNLIFMSNLKLTLIKRNTLKLLCDCIVTAVK